MFRALLLLFSVLLISTTASAQSGGGYSLVFSLGTSASDQSDIDALISRANSREGGISTSAMGSALEFQAGFGWRLSSLFELFGRLGYFRQYSNGSGTSGNFDYELDGFTFFPYLRIIPLENSYFKFFLQTGLGYGTMTGLVREGDFEIKFAGDRLGVVGGLGAEFCFVPAHCVRVEGNYRYMPIQRSLATSVSGTPNATSVSQAENKQEVEIDNRDLETTFSGIQGILSYVWNF